MRRWNHAAVAAIVAGALGRLVWGLIIHPPLDYVYSDMGGYVLRAQHLVHRGPFSPIDAFFPAGTHVILAVPFLLLGTGRTGLWAASVLWWGLSSVAPWLAWRWVRRVLAVPVAALAAIFCSLWPIYLAQPTYFMSEVPALALLLGGLLLAERVRGGSTAWYELAGLGATVGLGVAVRPQLVLNYALAIGAVIRAMRWRIQPIAVVAIGVAMPVFSIIALNTHAAGHLTLLSENTGVNFFLGQCDGGVIAAAKNGPPYQIVLPVYSQKHTGHVFYVNGHYIWDEGFFYREGWRCTRREGLGQFRLIGVHLIDLTVGDVPWPQYDDPAMRHIVGPTNVFYGLLAPTLLVLSAATFFGPGKRRFRGERLVFGHLVCVIPTVFVFASESRYRVPYDVFGLTLLAALIVEYRRRRTRRATADDATEPALTSPSCRST